MHNTGRILICATGLKGQRFVEHALARWRVAAVYTYSQGNVSEDSASIIRAMCSSQGITCIDDKRPDFKSQEPFDLCFLVGWQYMLEGMDDRFIVFHDSLLPRYRGFNPTSAALAAGEKQIGVTALFPVGEMDAGPILGQEAIDVDYPMTLGRAFELVSQCYTKIADRLVETARHAPLSTIARAQDESKATYSLWADIEDQRIDWTKDSATIERLVNAVAWPYTGAHTSYQGQRVIIHEVAVMPEVAFETRHPGKFWQLANNQPVVVCGSGMLKILRATSADNSPVTFARLRTRFV